MKPRHFIMLLILISTYSCVNRKYVVRSNAKIDDIEKSIHSQFYAALQHVNLKNGIMIIPQNITVKFDHTMTNTVSGGFSAFSIITSNYQYQNIKDNSVSDILTATKISSTGAPKVHFGYSIDCPFDIEKSSFSGVVAQSIQDLEEIIENAANTFANVPNMGLLNDHQITLDIKFTYSNQGDISVSPVFTALMFSKISGKFQKNIASSDDIQFTFDVVKNDVSTVDNARYNFLRDSIVKAHLGICGFYPEQDYKGPTYAKTLVTPPVQNQHDFNSCVAYAIGYTCLSTHLNTAHKEFDASNEYSPDFIYARLTSKSCNGLDLPTALNIIVKEGDCTVKEFPIVKKLDCATYNNEEAKNKIGKLRASAKTITDKLANGWLPLDPNNIDQIRLCIANGEPVIVALYESSSFTNMWYYGDLGSPGKNVWRTQSGPYTDAHCVCITGFDNVTKLFKVQNSWGKTNSAAIDPNEAGYFWVTYDMVQSGCFNQAYSFIPNR